MKVRETSKRHAIYETMRLLNETLNDLEKDEFNGIIAVVTEREGTPEEGSMDIKLITLGMDDDGLFNGSMGLIDAIANNYRSRRSFPEIRKAKKKPKKAKIRTKQKQKARQ